MDRRRGKPLHRDTGGNPVPTERGKNRAGSGMTTGGDSPISACFRSSLFPLRGRLLREPDYRQVVQWAKELQMTPEMVLRLLESAEGASKPAGKGVDSVAFGIENGAIVSLLWDLEKMRGAPSAWQEGLRIRELGFRGSPGGDPFAVRPFLASLARLSCEGVNLAGMELSGAPRLSALVCSHCTGLTELDLAPVPGLARLAFRLGQLTRLDLSALSRLTDLDCFGNQLQELDLSSVPMLTRLNCRFNRLARLDLSPVPGLERLDCGNNRLTTLDLSRTPRLTEIHCRGNRLEALDLSKTPGLASLSCGSNRLKALDLARVPGLAALECDGNQLVELDLSPVTGLAFLRCDRGVRLNHAPPGLTVRTD